jgi:hypothetical protein
MRPEDLLDRLQDRPFQAFRIHLSDGTVLDVPEPGMVIVGRSTAVLPSRFGLDEEGRRLAEHWRTISLVHMVQFSDLAEGTNGKRRRRRRA